MPKSLRRKVPTASLVLALSVLAFLSAPIARGTTTVASDWPMFNHSSDHSGLNAVDTAIDSSNVNQLTVKWKTETGGEVWSAPTVADGTVFVGSDDGRVYALDAATGTPMWTVATGGRVRSAPAFDGGSVFVGSSDGTLYAIDAVTGGVRWSVDIGGAIAFAPTVAGGIVYVGAKGSGTLVAVDEITGAVRWTRQPSTSTWSSPAVVGGSVYMGWDNRRIYSLDAATGVTNWTTTLGGYVRSAPSVVNGVLYVGCDDSLLYALDAATGTILWSATTAPSSTLASVRSSPAVGDGLVYVDTAETNPMGGHLYAFDASTGSLLWSRALVDYSVASPAIANGIVYTAAGRELYAFDATTGQKYWTSGGTVMGGNVQQSDPALADGQLFIGSKDHYVYSFGIAPGQAVGSTVVVTDTGLSTNPIIGHRFGKQVDFEFQTTTPGSVADGRLDLIDSAPVFPGGTYLVALPGAGNYDYTASPSMATGTIKTPMIVTPAAGSLATVFDVTWAAGAPPPGFAYDVQILRPGATKWADWEMGQVAPSLPFTAPSTGTWAFKARLSNTVTGGHSRYSTSVEIPVS